MRRPSTMVFLSFIVLVGWPSRASAQNATGDPATMSLTSEEPPAGTADKRLRPRIGIALEGGGALGLAHIGVLQWFEDHHIPLDYIAGTSMGGLVGGLYASGKSPKQLKQLIQEQSWDLIVGGQTPYSDLSYRRKEDLREFQNSIVLGLKHGLSGPSALNAGREIRLLIDRETLPYSSLESFDDLPIPFRCVATDLVSGKEVVFSNGSLQQALRATMSVPGLFPPVRDGEKVYVDGGLLGNLPTDVVREMGADIVIAVHLEVAPANPQEIQSLLSILGRSIDVVIRDNEIRGLSNADLVVNVDLRAYNSMDYAKAETLLALGEKAAAKKEQILLPYALDGAGWREHLESRQAREKNRVPAPQFVRVEGTDPQSARHLERSLQSFLEKPIDSAELGNSLTRLTGTGKYDSASYRVASRNGQDGLIVTMHEKTYAPPTLQIGAAIDGSESDEVTFTQSIRLTFMDIAGYRSEWRTDFQFGNTYGVETDLYRPFGGSSKWFFAPRAAATDTSFKIFGKNKPLADYRLGQAGLGVDLGYAFSRFTEVRLGYEVGYLNAKLRLGTPQFSSVAGRLGNTRLHFLTDHRDNPVAPRRGYSTEATFRWYDTNPGAAGAFPLMQARADYFLPVSQPASIFLIGEGGTGFASNHIGIPQFFLGGPSHLSAYGTNELYGDQFYNFRLGYLHELATLPRFIGGSVYAVGSYEFGRMKDFPNQSGFPNDVAAGVLVDTVVGPLLVGGSVGDTGHKKWFFQLGHIF